MKPLPCEIAYVPVRHIAAFHSALSDTVQVQLGTDLYWIDIPTRKGTLQVASVRKPTEGGPAYTSSISATIKQSDYKLPPDFVIIKIKYTDGTHRILGTPDVPIRISGQQEQYRDTISIDYTHSTPPLILQ